MNKAARHFALPFLIVISGLAIIATHGLLGARIAEQQRRETEAIYFSALHIKPTADIQLTPLRAVDDITLLGLRVPQNIYIARRETNLLGVVLPLTSREGYAGDIDLLLGIDSNGAVISVRVISQWETHGLGDKITTDKSHWLQQFHGATFDELQKAQWQLRDDGGVFDGITGATVTSRAVVKAIQQGLAYFAQHREELLGNTVNAQ